MVQVNFDGEKFQNKTQIKLNYFGPSFNDFINLKDFLSQLKNLEDFLIKTMDNLHLNGKTTFSSKDAEILINLERGSLKKIFLIVFSNPVAINIISHCLIESFRYIIKRTKIKDNSEKIEKPYFINEGIVNVNYFSNTINNLKQQGDFLKIEVPHTGESLEINFEDKSDIEFIINEIKSEEGETIIEKNFVGYLNYVNLDKHSYGFMFEDSKKSYKTTFPDTMNLEKIKALLGEKLNVFGKIFFKAGEIQKISILKYTIEKNSNLNSFGI